MNTTARDNGSITSRYFTPFDCHAAHAVSGGLCLAAACLMDGSVANQMINFKCPQQTKFEQDIIIEHPSGKIATSVYVDQTTGTMTFPRASFIRTARPLFEGHAVVASLISD